MKAADTVYFINETNLNDLVEKVVERMFDAQKNEAREAGGVRTYSREQCIEILHCSYPTFHSFVKSGKIKIIKAGRKTLVDADEFDRDLKAGALGKYRR